MARTQRPRGNFEPVGSLIGNVLARLGLDTRLREYEAVRRWAEVVGPEIAAHSTATSIRDGALFVDVKSNVWMQELWMMHEQIIEQLNTHLGGPVVRKLVLSIEQTPLPAPDRDTMRRPR